MIAPCMIPCKLQNMQIAIRKLQRLVGEIDYRNSTNLVEYCIAENSNKSLENYIQQKMVDSKLQRAVAEI